MGNTLLLTNGNIVNVTNGTIHYVKDIFIENGIIAKIGEGLEHEFTSVPLNNLNGSFIMPGMINTHAHLTIPMAGILQRSKDIKLSMKLHAEQRQKSFHDCLRFGITTIRDALTDRLADIQQLQREIDNEQLNGPEIITSGHLAPLGGTYAPKLSGMLKFIMKLMGHKPIDYSSSSTGVVAMPEERNFWDFEKAINELSKRGADSIKLCLQDEKLLTYAKGAANFSEKELENIAQIAGERKLRTNIHCIRLSDFELSSHAGINTLAHLPIDGLFSQTFLTHIKNKKQFIEPTLTVIYYYCWLFNGNEYYASENMQFLNTYRDNNFTDITEKYWIKELQESVMYNYQRIKRQKFKTGGFLDLSKVYKLMNGYIHYGIENMKLLMRHAPDNIIFGNDSGASHCSAATKEIEIALIKYCGEQIGMQDAEINKIIIKMLTINGALSLGIDSKCGSVEDGKQADLAIYKKNPLEKIDILCEPAEMVYKKGKQI